MDAAVMGAESGAGAAPVALTERAARRIAKIAGAEAPGTALRLSVSGGGCSGFSYGFELTTEREADDIVITRDDATVLIDPVSIDYVRGSEIDFIDSLMGQSFQVKNPNATATCGCGTSFSV